jgi:hypothetical protein
MMDLRKFCSRRRGESRHYKSQPCFAIELRASTTSRQSQHPSFTLDETHLLILRLASPRPIGSDIDTVLFLLITLLLCPVHRCRLVLCRRIDGIQDKWCWASIDELMLGPCGNNNQISGFDILVFTGNGGASSSGCECQNLVDGVFLLCQRLVKHCPAKRTSSPMSPPTGIVMRTS